MILRELIMVCVAEEASEVSTAAMLCDRESLLAELNDLYTVVRLLEEQGIDLTPPSVAATALDTPPVMSDLVNAANLVVKAASKMLRFGPKDVNPGRHLTADQVLGRDLHILWRLAFELVGYVPDAAAGAAKRAKFAKYRDYSVQCGTLSESTTTA